MVLATALCQDGSYCISGAILTALCALVMPLQGLYWLGKRAKSPLEPQSSQWFYEISERLRKQHESLPTVQDKPTYQHLAEVLQRHSKIRQSILAGNLSQWLQI